MKKVISSLILIILILSHWKAIASTSMTISAVVGNSNHAPVVTLVDPNSNPRYLNNSTVDTIIKQSYLIRFRDDETDEVNYTITVEEWGWSTTVTSWTIIPTQYDTNNEAYITFDYITPTEEVGEKSITVTISDGPNITIQVINVYIY